MAFTQHSASYDATHLWLMRHRAWYGNGHTYAAYLDYTNNDLMLGDYNHATKSWSETDTGYNAAQANNPHAAHTLMIDDDGHICFSMGLYGGASGNCYYKRTSNPYDLSSWGTLYTVATPAGLGANQFTYPIMFQTSDGTMIHLLRATKDTTDEGQIHRHRSTDDGVNWGNDQVVLECTSADDRPYYDAHLDSNGRLHLAYSYYQSAGANYKDLYYAYTDDPEAASPTWKDAAGNTLSLPIGETAGCLVYDSDGGGWDDGYLLGITCEADGTPHIVLYLHDSVGTDRLDHFKWNGSSWSNSQIVESNAIGPTPGTFSNSPIDGDLYYRNGILYCLSLVQESGDGEIHRYKSTDDGDTWSDESVTSSTGADWMCVCRPTNANPGCGIVALNGDPDYAAAHDIVAFEEPVAAAAHDYRRVMEIV